MNINLNELINGWVLEIIDEKGVKSEFVETKREAFNLIDTYITNAQIHELNLLIEGSRQQ